MSDIQLAQLRTDSHFSGALVQGLRVDQTTMEDKEFDECRFQSCSFRETVFRRCAFRECAFTDCNLAVIKVPGSQFQGVLFRRSKVMGVDWTECQFSALSAAPLRFDDRCTLDHSFFVGLKLKNSVFRNCTARDVDFSRADLSGCDFSQTDLTRTRFNQTNLRGSKFDAAFNYSINLATNDVRGAQFSLPEALSLLECAGIVLVDGSQRHDATGENVLTMR